MTSNTETDVYTTTVRVAHSSLSTLAIRCCSLTLTDLSCQVDMSILKYFHKKVVSPPDSTSGNDSAESEEPDRNSGS